MLSPNALQILDSLGVYERIRVKGYNFERSDFKNEAGETTGSYYFGHEEFYGYKGLWIYRQVLIDELKSTCKEQNIPVHYERKLTGVVSESEEDSVKFEFADGVMETAVLLIGADCIHSKVRRYINSTAGPIYSGTLAITSTVQKSALRFPPGVQYHLPTSISAKAGAFILAPQGIEGEELLSGTQRKFPERDREGWDQLSNAKGDLLAILRGDRPSWPDLVQSVLENIKEESISIWPFYVVPKLPNWASPGSRVIILGDAAHAIPPPRARASTKPSRTFTPSHCSSPNFPPKCRSKRR